jgi:hypothetical protein
LPKRERPQRTQIQSPPSQVATVTASPIQSDPIPFRVNYDRSLSRQNTEEIEEAIDVNIDTEERPEILNGGNLEDNYGGMF